MSAPMSPEQPAPLQPPKKRRGRPPKVRPPEETEEEPPTKRKRGRPAKPRPPGWEEDQTNKKKKYCNCATTEEDSEPAPESDGPSTRCHRCGLLKRKALGDPCSLCSQPAGTFTLYQLSGTEETVQVCSACLPNKLSAGEVTAKVCMKCEVCKPLTAYASTLGRKDPGKDGYHRWCEECVREDRHKRYYEKLGKDITVSEKQCKNCTEVKPATEFYKSSGSKDGLNNICKDCENQGCMKRYRDRLKAQGELCDSCNVRKAAGPLYLWVGNVSARRPCIVCIKEKLSDGSMLQKACQQCNTLRPIEQFIVESRSRDGIASVCLHCTGLPQEYRTCRGCMQNKPPHEFYKNKVHKDGLYHYCIQCWKAMYQKRGEKEVTVTEVHCTRCKTVKPASEFRRAFTSKTGLSTRCRTCTNEIDRIRHARKAGRPVNPPRSQYTLSQSAAGAGSSAAAVPSTSTGNAPGIQQPGGTPQPNPGGSRQADGADSAGGDLEGRAAAGAGGQNGGVQQQNGGVTGEEEGEGRTESEDSGQEEAGGKEGGQQGGRNSRSRMQRSPGTSAPSPSGGPIVPSLPSAISQMRGPPVRSQPWLSAQEGPPGSSRHTQHPPTSLIPSTLPAPGPPRQRPFLPNGVLDLAGLPVGPTSSSPHRPSQPPPSRGMLQGGSQGGTAGNPHLPSAALSSASAGRQTLGPHLPPHDNHTGTAQGPPGPVTAHPSHPSDRHRLQSRAPSSLLHPLPVEDGPSAPYLSPGGGYQQEPGVTYILQATPQYLPASYQGADGRQQQQQSIAAQHRHSQQQHQPQHHQQPRGPPAGALPGQYGLPAGAQQLPGSSSRHLEHETGVWQQAHALFQSYGLTAAARSLQRQQRIGSVSLVAALEVAAAAVDDELANVMADAGDRACSAEAALMVLQAQLQQMHEHAEGGGVVAW